MDDRSMARREGAGTLRTRRWLLAGCLALAACGGGDGSEQVPFVEMFEPFSRNFPENTYVITSQAQLDAAWSLAPQAFGIEQDKPRIDFAVESILGVSRGIGLRCHVPQIVEVLRSGDALLVRYLVREGGPTTLACARTWPLVDFVRVPAVHGTVTFQADAGGS